ncbi:MAG TPA: hypothetical protein RMF84_00305, partial [Polyangiaceae bacterium LLY-WYZ-14_1]|nr:hypothetical protein [Polyangiaceae bacterium LLY-WYZ-14_1]
SWAGALDPETPVGQEWWADWTDDDPDTLACPHSADAVVPVEDNIVADTTWTRDASPSFTPPWLDAPIYRNRLDPAVAPRLP